MAPSPTHQPLRSTGSNAPNPAVHHALQPGCPYQLAANHWAVLLAHSREKAIPQDPALIRNQSPFEELPRRALYRLGGHPLRALYEDVLFPHIAAIVQQSGLPWRTFGAYRQGWSRKTHGSVPALAVWCVTMGRPEDDVLRDAQRLTDELDELLSQHGLGDVHVEVAALYLPGRVGVAYNNSDDDGDDDDIGNARNSSVLAVYHPFLPGSSVGPQGATGAMGSGTFSGYVRLQQGKAAAVQGRGAGPQGTIFGLTCHRVAALAQENPMAALAVSDGVQLNNPAATDHARAVETIQASLEKSRRQIAAWETEKEERAMMGKPWADHRQERLEAKIQQLQNSEADLQHVEACWETDTRLGRVLLSSGARMPPGGHQPIEDWALVELNQAPLQQQRQQQQDGGSHCRPPPHVTRQYWDNADLFGDYCGVKEIPPSTLDLLIDVDACSQHNDDDDDDDALPTVAELLALAQQQEDPTYVVLRGCSTPFGIGVLHDVRDGVRTRYGQTEMVSRELTALDASRRATFHNIVLSRKGDSGAPVRTLDGRLIGFVLSSNLRDPLGQATTHIAVAETVAASIARATGAERVTFVGRDEAVGV